MTQKEAADIVGLSRRGYQNLEMGTYKKMDSKTMSYCLGRLEALPNKRKNDSLSLSSLTRALEDVLAGEKVTYVYAAKETRREGPLYRFALATDIDEFELLSLEEELSAMLRADVTFLKLSDLLNDKERAIRFFETAKRILPR